MLEIAATLHRGKVARQQQDALLIHDTIHQTSNVRIITQCLTDDTLLAVADGLYSSPLARRASRIVLDALLQMAGESHPQRLQDGGFITGWHLRRVQEHLAQRLAHQRESYGAASTLALAQVRGRRAVILNIGDSRVYRTTGDGQWQRLSKDHTVLQGLIDCGKASPDQEYASLYGMLEHALCADAEATDFAIHCALITLAVGDRLVLCSDGIHDTLGEERMWALFDPLRGGVEQVGIWRDAVWQRGAPDNFSLIVAAVTA